MSVVPKQVDEWSRLLDVDINADPSERNLRSKRWLWQSEWRLPKLVAMMFLLPKGCWLCDGSWFDPSSLFLAQGCFIPDTMHI